MRSSHPQGQSRWDQSGIGRNWKLAIGESVGYGHAWSSKCRYAWSSKSRKEMITHERLLIRTLWRLSCSGMLMEVIPSLAAMLPLSALAFLSTHTLANSSNWRGRFLANYVTIPNRAGLRWHHGVNLDWSVPTALVIHPHARIVASRSYSSRKHQ
jgi:hypothetical protein